MELIKNLQGVPWKLTPQDERPGPDVRVKMLTEEEKIEANKSAEEEEERRAPYRMRLTRTDFEQHGCTQGCQGCNAILRQMTAVGHSDARKKRMMEAIARTEEGLSRKRKTYERINEHIANKISKAVEKAQDEEHTPPQPQSSQSSGSSVAPECVM